MAKNCLKLPKWPKIAQKLPKMLIKFLKCPKIAKNYQNGQKISQK